MGVGEHSLYTHGTNDKWDTGVWDPRWVTLDRKKSIRPRHYKNNNKKASRQRQNWLRGADNPPLDSRLQAAKDRQDDPGESPESTQGPQCCVLWLKIIPLPNNQVLEAKSSMMNSKQVPLRAWKTISFLQKCAPKPVGHERHENWYLMRKNNQDIKSLIYLTCHQEQHLLVLETLQVQIIISFSTRSAPLF